MNRRKIYRIFNDYKLYFRIGAIILILLCALFFYWKNNSGKNHVTKEDFLQIESLDKNEESSSKDKSKEDRVKGKEYNGEMIFVDIDGAINKPGVYEVPIDTRVFQVIEKAGGLSEEADARNINKAEKVNDGERIYVSSKGEENHYYSGSIEENSSKGILINLNTADKDKLQSISGIGPSTAEKIIDYRKNQGQFKTIEDLKNVSGIGDKTFDKIKNKIKV